MSETAYTVRIHDEEDGLWAEIVELPGCFATGDTRDELLEALTESLALWTGLKVERVAWTDPNVVEQRILVNA